MYKGGIHAEKEGQWRANLQGQNAASEVQQTHTHKIKIEARHLLRNVPTDRLHRRLFDFSPQKTTSPPPTLFTQKEEK